MSELTVEDGKLVVREGTLGIGQGCCCEKAECTCAQIDVSSCPDAFEITFTGIGVFDPACTQDFTLTANKASLASGGVDDGWSGEVIDPSGSFSSANVVIACDGGRWVLNIAAAFYPFDCPTVQSVSLDLGSVCQCPQAGTFSVLGAYDIEITVVVA